jgi:hypothetical protein
MTNTIVAATAERITVIREITLRALTGCQVVTNDARRDRKTSPQAIGVYLSFRA